MDGKCTQQQWIMVAAAFSSAPHAIGKSCAPCRILLWVWPTSGGQVGAETPGLLVGQVHRGLQLLPPSVRCDRDEVTCNGGPPRVFKHWFSGRMILFYLLSNAPYLPRSTLRHCCVVGDIRADREAIVNRCQWSLGTNNTKSVIIADRKRSYDKLPRNYVKRTSDSYQLALNMYRYSE